MRRCRDYGAREIDGYVNRGKVDIKDRRSGWGAAELSRLELECECTADRPR